MSDVKVTISGSYHKHFDRIVEAKRAFEGLGAEVLRPRGETIESKGEDLVRLRGDPDDETAIQEAQLEAIKASDLLYVVNPGGYVGSSATLEVGAARAVGIAVVTSERSFEPAVRRVGHVGTPDMALQVVSRSERAVSA